MKKKMSLCCNPSCNEWIILKGLIVCKCSLAHYCSPECMNKNRSSHRLVCTAFCLKCDKPLDNKTKMMCQCKVSAYCSDACRKKDRDTHRIVCRNYRNDPGFYFVKKYPIIARKLDYTSTFVREEEMEFILLQELLDKQDVLVTTMNHYNRNKLEDLKKLLKHVDPTRLARALEAQKEQSKNNKTVTFIVQSCIHPKSRCFFTIKNRNLNEMYYAESLQEIERKTKKAETRKEEKEEKKSNLEVR